MSYKFATPESEAYLKNRESMRSGHEEIWNKPLGIFLSSYQFRKTRLEVCSNAWSRTSGKFLTPIHASGSIFTIFEHRLADPSSSDFDWG